MFSRKLYDQDAGLYRKIIPGHECEGDFVWLPALIKLKKMIKSQVNAQDIVFHGKMRQGVDVTIGQML